MQNSVSEAYGGFQQAPLGTREAKLVMTQKRRKPLRRSRLESIHSPVGQWICLYLSVLIFYGVPSLKTIKHLLVEEIQR